MKILFAAAEAAPFAKTGGLGDVIGSLPRALRRLGLDARVVLPLYGTIPREYRLQMTEALTLAVPEAGEWRRCKVKTLQWQGVPVYFLENEAYFNRERIYAYPDDAARFAFFSRAALEFLPAAGFRPDIIHSHDWHTALISVYLRSQYASAAFYRDIQTVLTIHNPDYQGKFARNKADGTAGRAAGASYARLEAEEANYLKGGLLAADRLTTVSPGYARELMRTDGELGQLLARRMIRLDGIVNGIDNKSYNPLTDKVLYKNFRYSPRNKGMNKPALQRELGLEVNAGACLLGMVCRLTEQKGLDLLLEALPELFSLNVQLVLLGTGEKRYETALRQAAALFPGRFALRIAFDESLARRIYAAADIFLMPSRTEPCGLSQLLALRYGAVPVVHATGGLKDTILPYDGKRGAGNGFTFTEFTAPAFLAALREAYGLYGKPREWAALVKKAALSDYDWRRPAGVYARLYTDLIAERKTAQ